MKPPVKQKNNSKSFFSELIDEAKHSKVLKLCLTGLCINFSSNFITHKTEVEKDPTTGRIVRETQVDRFSGKKDGRSIEYYTDGEIAKIEHFKDGKQHGLTSILERGSHVGYDAKLGKYVPVEKLSTINYEDGHFESGDTTSNHITLPLCLADYVINGKGILYVARNFR